MKYDFEEELNEYYEEKDILHYESELYSYCIKLLGLLPKHEDYCHGNGDFKKDMLEAMRKTGNKYTWDEVRRKCYEILPRHS
jgi:hypothetical protein